jgi:hypothetical protein
MREIMEEDNFAPRDEGETPMDASQERPENMSEVQPQEQKDEKKDEKKPEKKLNLTPASVVMKDLSEKPFKLLSVVLALIILVLGVYIVVDKTSDLSRRQTAGSSQSSQKDNGEGGEENEGENIASKREGYIRQWEFGNFYVTSAGEVYFDFFIPGNSNIQFVLNEKNMPAERDIFTIKKDQIANFWSIDTDDMVIDGYKLKLNSKIVSVTDMGWGQSVTSYDFGLISEDGELSVLSINISGEVTLKENVGDYANVAYTAVSQGADGAMTTIFFRDGTYKNILEREKL